MERNQIIDEVIKKLKDWDTTDTGVIVTDSILNFITGIKSKTSITPVIDLLTYERRSDMLCGALEGGLNYWYYLSNLREVNQFSEMLTQPLVDRIIYAVINKHISVPINDIEDSSTELGIFNLINIRKGEELMKQYAKSHWSDIIKHNDDATTADIWFQYCVLGDIVYG